jgi:hypothetical protein
MADNTSSGGGALAFILGGVVVVLAGLIWFFTTGGELPGEDTADISIELPGVEAEGNIDLEG